MSHKELCASWVEERRCENMEGQFFLSYEAFGDFDEGPFDTEETRDDRLWELVLEEDFTYE